MKTVTKRELNQQTAQVLAAVEAGEATLVSERGVVRWRIEAVDTGNDPVDRLRREGRITPAKAHPADWPDGDPAAYSVAEVDAIFAESRGDH